MDALTIEEFKSALPTTLRKSVNQELIDQITDTLADPDMYISYRENLLGYINVMKEGRFKLSDYINAVKYVSHKVCSKSNRAAFTITFPDRVQRWQLMGKPEKDQHSQISNYNKSKLVNLIYSQVLIPTHVLNHDIKQGAINHLNHLMLNSASERIQMESALGLVRELKAPETNKIELDIAVKEDSAIDLLRTNVEALVAQQRAALSAGTMTPLQMAHQSLRGEVIEGEFEEDTDG